MLLKDSAKQKKEYTNRLKKIIDHSQYFVDVLIETLKAVQD